MSTGTEDFEKLRKLLKLKRHEQPPPGYFSGFSQHVISRLEADGESARDAGKMVEAPWLVRFLRTLEANPFLAGALGVLVCGSLIGGVVFSQQNDTNSIAAITPSSLTAEYAAAPADSTAPVQVADSLHPTAGAVFGTNVSGNSFNDFGARLQPVGFGPAN